MSRRAPATVMLVVALALTPSAQAEPPLQALARDVVGAGQGVLVVAEDGTVLASEAADRAVHPASVTKVATSLALLQRLGPDHRFTTTFRADGRVADGVLHGDLVVDASGDPFLVNEGAFLILQRLHAFGLRTVDGRLQVHGSLLFDWERDPAGNALARFLAGNAGGWTPPPGSPSLRELALAFGGRKNAGHGDATPIATYRSPPLLAILKALNGYSNNVFHLASDAIGGPSVVTTIARAAVPAELRDEIVITNAAGAGTTNRISPRAAVALLQALAHELARLGHDLTAVLPVSGIDPGTLRERLLAAPAGRGIVVGKTGTYGSEGASALAGMLHTSRYGTVTFALLNRGVAVTSRVTNSSCRRRASGTATGARPWPYTSAAVPAFDQAVVQ